MLKHFQITDTNQIRMALANQSINAVTFPEPPRPTNLPYMPEAPLRPFQFWLVREEWAANLTEFRKSIKSHFNEQAEGLTQRCIALFEMFTKLTDDRAPFISLRAITPEYFKDSKASVSAGWHRDASVFTLQDTVMGEPLEYTDDSNVNRAYFNTTQIQPFETTNGHPLKRPDLIKAVPHGRVAILKGELRKDEKDKDTVDFLGNFIDINNIPEFNRHKGLIHRGNKESLHGRLVLTISTHRIPGWMPKI